MIRNHPRPMVKLNRRELDHYRLDGEPGFHVPDRVRDEGMSGTAAIGRAQLQGRWFEIINHNNGGNPSYVTGELCSVCDGDIENGCDYCDFSGYYRDQPLVDHDARRRSLIANLRPKKGAA